MVFAPKASLTPCPGPCGCFTTCRARPLHQSIKHRSCWYPNLVTTTKSLRLFVLCRTALSKQEFPHLSLLKLKPTKYNNAQNTYAMCNVCNQYVWYAICTSNFKLDYRLFLLLLVFVLFERSFSFLVTVNAMYLSPVKGTRWWRSSKQTFDRALLSLLNRCTKKML